MQADEHAGGKDGKTAPAAVIQEFLNVRDKGAPFSVVIDTTMSLFADDEIRTLRLDARIDMFAPITVGPAVKRATTH